MPKPLPLLQTQRLLLTSARYEHLKTLQAHWADPLVRRYLFDDNAVDEELAKTVLDTCLEGSKQGHGLWLVLERGTKELIGSAALVPTSVAADYEPRLKGLLEPMITLAPARWGNGLATEALSAVLGHAFRTLTVTSVSAVNDVPNTASERMLLRAGFKVLSEVDGPKHRLRTYLLQRQSWLMLDDA